VVKGIAYALVFLMVALVTAPSIGAESGCVPVGTWMVPAGERLDGKDVLARAARGSVVLLGETHDSDEHHRWQLQTLAGLHALRPAMVVGFEMFPRRVQTALNRWVAGELSEAEFLKSTDWSNVWRFDPSLYLPLFHFARMNRIPMVALNIGEPLRIAVREKGFDGVPQAEREGVERPGAASGAYLDRLLEVFREHDLAGKKRPDATRDDPDFQRFVEVQQLWDGAMAQALRAAQARPGKPLVVALLGRGHIMHGEGVPHQLKALGVTDVTTLLPWDRDKDCTELVAGVADAVFGLEAPAREKPRRQRLGIRIELKDRAVHVIEVQEGSVAQAAGVRAGDVITEVAGQPVKGNTDVIAAVQRQAPGTWLPLKVKRQGELIEFVAKFPPLKP
jgi:uncharacterized iron-regulated protein